MTPISVYRLNRQYRRRLPASGFTLLEILLVLSIIALASVLVVPSLGNLEARTFSAQVRQATSLLNYARRTAVVRGQPSSASFYVNAEDDESAIPVERSSVGRWDGNGTDIRFRDSTDREIEVEEKIEIIFYPEGGSTGGTLLLAHDEQEVRIVIDPFTGRVSTEREDEG